MLLPKRSYLTCFFIQYRCPASLQKDLLTASDAGKNKKTEETFPEPSSHEPEILPLYDIVNFYSILPLTSLLRKKQRLPAITAQKPLS